MKRYADIEVLRNTNENVAKLGARYYGTTYYPEIPLRESDIYVITDFSDRLDALANQFYGDTTFYWIIAAANPDKVDFGSIFITEGTQLRIPTDINNIVSNFKNLNNA